MRRFFRFGASTAFVACLALAGCNAILDNEEGTPRADGGTASDASIAADGAIATPAAPSCDSTQKLCFGACAPKTDPKTGCGAEDSCVACDPKGVVAADCVGGASGYECAFTACTASFLDCDGKKANGCETSVIDKDNCGQCRKKCEGATPLCANNGGIIGCTDSCPAGTENCAGACVDITKSTDHCGKCGNACTRAGASATCDKGECKFTCSAATPKLCAAKNACVSPSDPAYCLGPDCNPCPVLPGTIASCSNGECKLQCAPGRYDCDRDTVAANGCESTKPCDPCAFLECTPVFQKCCAGKCIGATEACASVAQ